MGIGAHALDELQGHPLGTSISDRVLIALAISSITAACAMGIAVATRTTLWLLAFVAVAAFHVPEYNLERFAGRFHTDAWVAIAWGAFPLLTAYVACAQRLRVEAVLAAAWATLFSWAQRRLSTQVRRTRRQVVAVHGELELADGSREPVSRETLLAGPEAALRLLAASAVLIASALVALRL
jgi:hypothetical protein